MVLPTRLPLPSASVKRNQYTVAGFKPPTRTRQVQSETSESGTDCSATTFLNSESSATSTVSRDAGAVPGARRVQSRTLWLSGSPEATPSGNNSRRSRQWLADGLGKAYPQAAEAPRRAAISRNLRRLIVMYVVLSLK